MTKCGARSRHNRLSPPLSTSHVAVVQSVALLTCSFSAAGHMGLYGSA